MNCSRCGGELVERTVRFCAPNTSPPIMIEDVPAEVCKRCGGEVFSEEAVGVFEQIKSGQAPGPRFAVMQVYNFEKARRGEPTVTPWNGARAAMTVVMGSFIPTQTPPQVLVNFVGLGTTDQLDVRVG